MLPPPTTRRGTVSCSLLSLFVAESITDASCGAKSGTHVTSVLHGHPIGRRRVVSPRATTPLCQVERTPKLGVLLDDVGRAAHVGIVVLVLAVIREESAAFCLDKPGGLDVPSSNLG